MRLGHDVVVLTRPEERVDESVRMAPVSLARIPLIPPVPLPNLAIFNLQAYKKLKELTKGGPNAVVDIQHVHLSFIVNLLARSPEISRRTFLTCHGTGYFAVTHSGTGLEHVLNKFILSREGGTFRRISDIVCVSRFVKAEVEQAYPDVPLRIEVIPNGIRFDDFKNLKPLGLKDRLGADKLIVTIGRPHFRKGTDLLLRAFSELASKAAVLAIVGDLSPQARRRYISLERELGIESRVFHLSGLTRGEILALLAESDAYVQPSRYESQGIAVLEAMAAGKAVIAFRVGGMPESVGNAGVFVEPEKPIALADALRVVLGDANLRSSLGANARLRASKYDWREIALRYSRYCESFGT